MNRRAFGRGRPEEDRGRRKASSGDAPWRDSPRGIAELRLEYADGSVETVGTDASWRMAPTRTLYDCIREGEVTGAAERVVGPGDHVFESAK